MSDTQEATVDTDLSTVQPGDVITRDGQRYQVVEPSQVSAQALPKKQTQPTYLLKLTCGCKNGVIRASATAAMKRGDRTSDSFTSLPAELQATGWFCYLCNQPVSIATGETNQ